MSWLLNSFDLRKVRLNRRKRYTLRLFLIHLSLAVWEWIPCKRSFLDRTWRKRELWIFLVELSLEIVSLNLFNTKYMLRCLEILTFWGLYYIFFSDYTANLSVTNGSPETMFFLLHLPQLTILPKWKSSILSQENYIFIYLYSYLPIYLSIYLSIDIYLSPAQPIDR